MASKKYRQADLRKQQEEQEAARRRYLIIGGVVAAAVVLIVGAYFLTNRKPVASSTGSAGCSDIQQLADEGSQHLNPGDPRPDYKTNPPTSGNHNPIPYPAGVYDQGGDITRVVHSLEHGYVVIYYNNLTPAEAQQLASIQNSDPNKVIVYYDKDMPGKVAIAGWTRLQTCDGVNESAIRSFINQFRGQGPEPFGA